MTHYTPEELREQRRYQRALGPAPELSVEALEQLMNGVVRDASGEWVTAKPVHVPTPGKPRKDATPR